MIFWIPEDSKNESKKIPYISNDSTLKGSRTPAACLEGKHDNRFTISVLSNSRLSKLISGLRFECKNNTSTNEEASIK